VIVVEEEEYLIQPPVQASAHPDPMRFAILFLILLCFVPPAVHAQADQGIYDEALQNGWANYSWATINLGNASPVHGGGKSISVVDPTTSYQALYLHHDQQITNGFTALHFWIYFSSSQAQPVQVQATRAGLAQTAVKPVNATPNAWTEITLPLSSLGVAGVTDFDGFWIQNITGSPLTFYVDDATLVATPQPAQLQISVDAGSTLRTLDGRLYGLNTAVWDTQLGNATTAGLLAAMGVQVLRHPGGSLSDEYDWQTDQGVLTPWFQWSGSTAVFLQMAAARGAQGCITVNYGTGTPEQAAAWVAYCNAAATSTTALGTDAKGRDWKTIGWWAGLRGASPLPADDGFNFLRIAHPAPFGISYWEIGNECYGGWETDQHGTSGSGLAGSPHDPYTYAQAFVVFYARMRQVDAGIQIGMVGITGEDTYGNGTHAVANPNAGNATHSGWTPVVLANLKLLGVAPQFLVHHVYPQNPGTENDATLLQSSATAATDAANLRKQITDYYGSGGTAIELQITELNSVTSQPGKQSVSLVNGLFLADMMGQLARTEFNACMWWDLRNGGDAGQNNSASLYGWRAFGDYGMVADGTQAGTPVNTPFPAFYTAKLLTHWGRGGDKIVSAGTNYALLAAHAARLANGNLALLVINKSPTADFTTQIALGNFLPGSANATMYAYTKANDLANADLTTSTITNAGASFSATFPSYSMSVIVLQAPAGFAAWQALKFTPAELGSTSISGPTADPDHDGLSNLLEYAFALEPKTASRAGRPVPGQQTTGGKTYLTYAFTQPRAITDLTYTVQVSADLITWNSGPAYVIRVDDGSTDQAVYRDVTALGDTAQHFLRLRVTQP
ncbi:MAG: putative alpha-L-arabinofuranosidase, partial [Verrucomicrobiaceae bacterium]|nr:putative alpha-L-arabinofuranosidase [Verrucomicrobiaceae bacterium]